MSRTRRILVDGEAAWTISKQYFGDFSSQNVTSYQTVDFSTDPGISLPVNDATNKVTVWELSDDVGSEGVFAPIGLISFGPPTEDQEGFLATRANPPTFDDVLADFAGAVFMFDGASQDNFVFNSSGWAYGDSSVAGGDGFSELVIEWGDSQLVFDADEFFVTLQESEFAFRIGSIVFDTRLHDLPESFSANLASFARVVFKASGVELAGSPLTDFISGTDRADVLSGRGGEDVIHGGDGNDLMSGDEANDGLYGDGGDDRLYGGAGGDSLFGGIGNDLLDGGAGSDFMTGGPGSDTYFVDGGDTILEFASDLGTTTVYARESFSLAAELRAEVLATADYRLTDRIDLTGNDYNNAVTGNNGVNVLRGGGGGDTLRGLAGTDILDGGAGIDQMFGGTENDSYYVTNGDRVYENAGEGVDRVYARETFVLTAGSEVEILATADYRLTTRLDLVGNAYNNQVTGNNGINLLQGQGGNDTLRGLDGNDTLDGGAGSDRLEGGTGNDNYYVDSGDTVVELAGEGSDSVYARTSFTLSAGAAVELVGTADYRLTNALDLTGNDLTNSVIGNNGVNALRGLGGNDVLRGLAGNDTLDGGTGLDTLYGGGGDDSFAFTTAPGSGNADFLADFDAAHDRIALENAVFTGLAPGALAAGAFRAGSAALDADDRIVYDQAAGRIWFDADGSGAGAQLLFATVTPGTALGAADFAVI